MVYVFAECCARLWRGLFMNFKAARMLALMLMLIGGGLAIAQAAGAAGFAQQTAAPPQQLIVVNIDAGGASPAVSKYQYGMFIEHIGSLIYRSLRSEMLDDRKFYFHVSCLPDGYSRRRKVSLPMRTPANTTRLFRTRRSSPACTSLTPMETKLSLSTME